MASHENKGNRLPPIKPPKAHGKNHSASLKSEKTNSKRGSVRSKQNSKRESGETHHQFKIKVKTGAGGDDTASTIVNEKSKVKGDGSEPSQAAFDSGEMGSFGDIFQAVVEDKKAKKKVIKRAPGAEEIKYHIGPEVIDGTNTERTPVPLWVKEASLARFSQVLAKTSDELIESTPVGSNIEEVRFIKDKDEKKSPEMSWFLSLTHIEEDEFDAEAEVVEHAKIKLDYDAPSSVDKEDIYIIIPSKINNPDGSITMKDKIRVILSETETQFTLQLKGNYVPDHSEHIHEVHKKNDHYRKVLRLHKESDAYTDRESQTFYERERDKSTLMKQVPTEELAIQADSFAIHDEFEALKEKLAMQKRKAEDDALMSDMMKNTTGYSEKKMKPQRRGSEMTDDSDDDYYRKGADDIDWALYDDSEDELKTPPNEISEEELHMSTDLDEFETALTLDEVYMKKAEKANSIGPKLLPDITFAIMIIERMISMNIHQDKQADMREFEILPPEREKTLRPMYMRQIARKSQLIDLGPALKRYWTFRSFSVTEGREVTAMILHPTNGNMICTAFGSVEFANESEGTVCIWSAKNVLYPERIYRFRVSVTAIAFSSLTPYLLAIGLIDGHLLVYDIRPNLAPQIIYSTIGTTNKHTGPIWEIAWMKESEVSSSGKVKDILISIDDEGLIYRWAGGSGKGFNFQTMLKIRRSSLKIPGRRERRAEALISQHSATFAICFLPHEPGKYLIGTEEGFIHKCSVAYSEQFLSTYIGHAGPIYRIVFSTFTKDIFITSSGDWSVKIWKEDSTTPLISLMTGLRTIFDVTPCPFMSSVFICLAEFEIQVWDLTMNTLEPVIQLTSNPPNGLRKVLFSDHLKSVIIADTEGIITLYGLRNFPIQPDEKSDQIEQLLEQIIPGHKRPVKDTLSLQLDGKASRHIHKKYGRGSMKNMSKAEREALKNAKQMSNMHGHHHHHHTDHDDHDHDEHEKHDHEHHKHVATFGDDEKN